LPRLCAKNDDSNLSPKHALLIFDFTIRRKPYIPLKFREHKRLAVLVPDSFVFDIPKHVSRLSNVVVRLSPETESRLREFAAATGRTPDDLVEDAMTGYPPNCLRFAKCLTAGTMTLRAAASNQLMAKE